MAQATSTFRIFVSSTFSDLKEERNALNERVFPKLRKLCMQRGARFQAIDLRWGVSEEAALDQRTMNICLDEIERCQKTTPRPNFIVLLGDRYGWRPPPPQIPADEFEHIIERVTAGEQRALLRKWYWKDENAVPPEYCLQPREGAHKDPDTWSPVERDLHAILLGAVEGMALAAADQTKYAASATEQEITRGALGVPDADVFCFFRTIQGLPDDDSAKDFVDLDENGRRDSAAEALLRTLKKGLRRLLPKNVSEYQVTWRDGGPSLDHIDRLCRDVETKLWGVMKRQIEELEAGDALDREVADHDRFGDERASHFIGRADILRRIGYYAGTPDGHPLVVWGASGSGKSALMARAAHQARNDQPEAEVIVRLIGATPESSDGRALLSSLCRQISRVYGADEATVPTDYRELVEEFPKRLALATAERPLVLFLDALDQLRPGDAARSLTWVPTEVPDHVGVIVSTLPGECLTPLQNRLPDDSLVVLEPMPEEEGGELLDRWLEDRGRILQKHQRKEVLGKFKLEGLPLYLKLAFEEARLWKSYTKPSKTELTAGIPGIIRENLFARLSAETSHGEALVAHSLGFLGAAKNGISEDELLEVLSRDKADTGVLADFKRRSPRSPDVDRLPVVVWSRLYFDLEPYLTERGADGASLMAFYHRQLAEAVAKDYLAGDIGRDRHRELARYFGEQEIEIEAEGQATPNLRKMSELPYQQTMGGLWDEVLGTLTDFQFLERKAAEAGVVETTDAEGKTTKTYTGIFQLDDDFTLALERMPGSGESAAGGGRFPIIVTAVDLGSGLAIRCPFCNISTPFNEDWLGQEIECPHDGCGARLKVNPFVVSDSGR